MGNRSKQEFYATIIMIVTAFPFSMRENPGITTTLIVCPMLPFATWMQNIE